VLPVYNQFVETYNSPGLLANADTGEIEKLLYTLGLHWRAKFLKHLAEVLNNTDIPLDYDLLVKLPAIGDYVASAFLSLHGYKRKVLIVAHIVRLFCRYTGHKPDGETRRDKSFIELIEYLTPKIKWKDFNYAILDFSMIICKKRPNCVICPIKSMCEYFSKGVL
jgi:A/G-specific adenine glycosylase